MAKIKEDPKNYPWLGQVFHWLAAPEQDKKLFWGLAIFCAFLFGLSFTFHFHGYNALEETRGFYAVYGFVMFTLLIFAATGLRWLIKRREDFYAPYSVEAEEYPKEGTEREEHNA